MDILNSPLDGSSLFSLSRENVAAFHFFYFYFILEQVDSHFEVN
jgi:hypothetical protein